MPASPSSPTRPRGNRSRRPPRIPRPATIRPRKGAAESEAVVLVKLGGSLLTDKRQEEKARPEVIRRLAEEIARAQLRQQAWLVLGHGSGSFGHASAARFGLGQGAAGAEQLRGAVETQASAARLHAQVLAALRAAGLPAFSLSPSGLLLSRRGQPFRVFSDPVLAALRAGLLPVVCGDVVTDDRQGVAIASTEAVFLALTRTLHRRRVAVRRALWLGETAGILDPAGRVRSEISALGFPAMLASLQGASGTDVTGGIRHRVETALRLARFGVESWIGDGREPGLLERALLGEPVPGTRVAAEG